MITLPLVAAVLSSALQPGPVGPVIPIATDFIGIPPMHDTAYSPLSDRYLSVYAAVDPAAGAYFLGEVRAVLINPTDGTTGAPITLQTGSSFSSFAAVAWNASTRRFLVTWVKDYLVGSSEIFGILVDDMTGAPDGSSFRISEAGSGPRYPVGIAGDGSGWLVIWDQANSATVRGCIVNGDATIGTPFDISSAGLDPVVSFGAGADYLVVWQDSTGNAIMGCPVSPSGLVGAAERYDSGSTGTVRQLPAVAADSRDGGFLVAWRESNAVGAANCIVATRVNAVAAPIGLPFDVSNAGIGREIMPYIAVTWNAPAGQYLVAWLGRVTPAYEYDLEGTRIYAQDGSIVEQDVILVPSACLPGGYGGSVVLTARTSDSQILAQWQAPIDIMAQRFDLGSDPKGPSITGLGQRQLDGTTPIPAGGAAATALGIVAVAQLADPNGDAVRLQFEAQRIDLPFTGIPTATSPSAPGGSIVSMTIGGLQHGLSYHWQARAIDSGNHSSDWVRFGGNGEGQADFVLPNELPSGALPGQRLRSGGVIPLGQTFYEPGVRFEIAVGDPDGDAVRIEVEVRRVGEDFTNTPSATGEWAASGSTARVDVSLGGGSWRWQYRLADAAMTTTAWSGFGGNSDALPDFILGPVGSSNNVAGCALFSAARGSWPLVSWLAAIAMVLRRRR